MRRCFAQLCRLTAPAIVGLVAIAAIARAAERPPNVVLVITDDQGYGDLACHGNTMIRTPNLDRLHGESTRLTDYHVDPTCSPTRSALMTGRYSSRVGVWHTIMGRHILRRDETTMAQVFAASGYRTGMFGKWHLGDHYPYRPQDRGFDEVLMHGGGGVTQLPDYWGNDYFDDTYFRNGLPEPQQGYCTDVFFDAALDFIEEHRAQPFFCYLATNAPHGPYLVADEYAQPYRDAGVPSPMAEFYGMITNIDDNMGRLVAALDAWGLANDTILIFTTDNGTAAGYTAARPQPRAQARARSARAADGREAAVLAQADSSWTGFNAGMRGTKGSEYDGGHRVPSFWRWPGKLAAGRDIETLTAHVDVLPTLIDVCELKPPAGVEFDGTSLAAVLQGEPLARRPLLVHSQRIEHPEKWKTSAVMTERWRLINGRELYDIESDPGQTHDVAADYSRTVSDLREAYERWWASISVRFDEYCPIVLGAPQQNPTQFTSHDWHSDNVPWSQQMVERDPVANGFWVVEVSQPGTYDITLRRRPAHAAEALGATKARIEVLGQTREQAVVPQAEAVTFRMPLEPGEGRLQTWLENAEGESRGAYFVEVRRLP